MARRGNVKEESYWPSFALDDDPEAIRAYFKQNGMVVFRDVLSVERIEATISAIWSEIARLSNGEVLRDQPSTWGSNSWPTMRTGVFHDIADHAEAWRNRESATVHRAYSILYECEDLLVSVDRFGVMRPVTNVCGKNHPEWRSTESWFHWDLNPWIWTGQLSDSCARSEKEQLQHWKDPKLASQQFISENSGSANQGFLRLQGLITLTDSTDMTGGFQAVPGFNLELADWAQRNPSRSGDFIRINKDPLIRRAQKITMRPGSMVVWSSELPHCNYPVDGEGFRMCQYIKMFPVPTVPSIRCLKARTSALRQLLPKDYEVTPLGRRLFGLDPQDLLHLIPNAR